MQSTKKTFLEEIIECKQLIDTKRKYTPVVTTNYAIKKAPEAGIIPLTGYGGGHRGTGNLFVKLDNSTF
jgi:hypothetical protein